MIDLNVTFGGTQLKDFLAALVKPLQTNTDLLLTFETQVTKEAHWNGRKIVLQAALNDLFGITSDPFIYIESNRDIVTNFYIYEESELTPVYVSEVSENDPLYFSESSELGTVDYDFIVWIPTSIWTTEVERRVKAYTNLYKLAGPNFIIQTY
jgi:hypothetical protein